MILPVSARSLYTVECLIGCLLTAELPDRG